MAGGEGKRLRPITDTLPKPMVEIDGKPIIEKVINNHWEDWNSNKYKDYVSSMHSSGTMNGDSNGSFWYKREPTIEAITQRYGAPKNKFDFTFDLAK